MSKLLALHNITETKLKGVLELGAFPMPSLAITMDKFPYQSFGDITFVFKKSTVDPRASRCNDLYEADAYTCRFPSILYEFDEETIGEELEKTYHIPASEKSFHNLNANVWYDLEQSANVVRCIIRKCGLELSRDEVLNFLQNNYKYKGIRKENTDFFTLSGARRSIKGLTVPYTLDNIMKAMRRGSGEEGFLTMRAWKGILAKKLTSLSAIRNNFAEKEKAEAMYNALEKEYFALNRRLSPIINKGCSGSSWIDMENYLFEVRNPTPENYMKIFSNYDMEIDEELAEEITALAIKVRELPVSYIEAKPHRVVHFSEVAAVIIPDALSIKEEIREVAEENNFKVYEYRDEKERQEAVCGCAADPAVTIKTF